MIFMGVFSPSQSFGNTCGSYFYGLENSHFGLKSSQTFSLPEAFKRSLLNRPRIKELIKKYKGGANYVMRLSSDDASSANGKSPEDVIQISFLKKILNVLFPHAEFDTQAKPIQSSRKHVSIHVSDANSDSNSYLNRSSAPSLPLSYLKISNSASGFLRGQKSHYKKIMNLRAKNIIHIYYEVPPKEYYKAFVELTLMIQQVRMVYPKAIIFLSPNARPDFISEFILYKGNPEIFSSAYRLSEVARKRTTIREGVVVLNNIKGMIPYLNVVSDALIVKGPNHLFEGLHVGTRTLIFNNDSTLQKYDRQGYEEMLETALATKGAETVSEIKDIRKGLIDTLALKENFVSPQFVLISEQTTEQAMFFDVLTSYLEQEFSRGADSF